MDRTVLMACQNCWPVSGPFWASLGWLITWAPASVQRSRCSSLSLPPHFGELLPKMAHERWRAGVRPAFCGTYCLKHKAETRLKRNRLAAPSRPGGIQDFHKVVCKLYVLCCRLGKMTGYRPWPVSSAQARHCRNLMPKYNRKRWGINAKTPRCKDARICAKRLEIAVRPPCWR